VGTQTIFGRQWTWQLMRPDMQHASRAASLKSRAGDMYRTPSWPFWRQTALQHTSTPIDGICNLSHSKSLPINPGSALAAPGASDSMAPVVEASRITQATSGISAPPTGDQTLR